MKTVISVLRVVIRCPISPLTVCYITTVTKSINYRDTLLREGTEKLDRVEGVQDGSIDDG